VPFFAEQYLFARPDIGESFLLWWRAPLDKFQKALIVKPFDPAPTDRR
jgi:hypothetical protein